MWKSQVNYEAIPRPIPMSFSIPGGMVAGQKIGNVSLRDKYTASISMGLPLTIPDNTSCNLIQASFAYSQPNVASAGQIEALPDGNNIINISYNGGVITPYAVPTGLYSYTDIQYALNQIAILQGWITTQNLFILQGIPSTQQLVITIDPTAFVGGQSPAAGFAFNFIGSGTMGILLGFTAATTYVVPGNSNIAVSFTGNVAASFSDTSSYVLYMSILTASYSNGITGQLLYSFPLGANSPNTIASYEPKLRFPVPCAQNSYTNIEIWMTDQSGNRLPWQYFQAPTQFSILISKNKKNGTL